MGASDRYAPNATFHGPDTSFDASSTRIVVLCCRPRSDDPSDSRCPPPRAPSRVPGGKMKHVRWLALAAILVVSVSTLGVTAVSAGAQSSGTETPTATDVGITPTEIHVAVIADVDNAI